MPVRIGPGQMQLTVTPCRPSSTAKLFVNPTTPAFVAAYAANPRGRHDRLGRCDVDDPTATVCPLEVGQRSADESGVGGQVHVDRAGPVRLEALVVLERRADERDAGVVDEDVESAEPLDHLRDELLQRRRVGHVDHEPFGGLGAVRGTDLVDHGDDSLRADVDHGDTHAFVGEELRGGASHAGGRAGDDRPLAGHRTREGGEPAHGCEPYRRATRRRRSSDSVP